MGDRTTVRLTVLKAQAKKTKSLLVYAANDEGDEEDGTYFFIFEDCNYGGPDCLDALQKAGIAYDSSWSSGSEYTSGTESFRFTETGEAILKEIYDDSINPDLYELIKRIDSPDDLRKYILIHKESIDVIDLDKDQIEYGKRYLARQLIEPK